MFKKSLLFILPLLLFFGAWLMVSEDSLSVLDSKKYYFTTFTDQEIDEGASVITEVAKNPSYKAIQFELNPGFISPYAGFSISAKDQSWDLSAYNQVKLNVEVENTKNLEMTLTTYQDGVTKENEALTFRHNGIEIPITDNTSDYILPFDRMEIEQWWLERFKLRSSELGNANWGKAKTISFIAKIRLDEAQPQFLKVNSIVFSKNLNGFYWVSGFLILLWYLALVLYFRVKANKENQLVIKYQQTEVEPVNENKASKILEYIAINYTNPDLSLLQIGEALQVSEKQISTEIKKQFNLSFKEYLNGIRINEAKRLLQVSDKNVSEIAYQVGFNSPNHFNRIFKTVEDTTPSDFRKNL